MVTLFCPSFIAKLRRLRFVRSTAAILLLAIVGTVLLHTTKASTPSMSVEPEAGTINTTAARITDSTASGSAAVRFGSGSAAQPTALYAPPAGKMYIGLSTSSHNNYVTNFDQAAGISTHPAIFNDYTAADGDMQNQFDNIGYGTVTGKEPALAGITPMVSWNLTMANDVVTNGSKDAYITKMANEAKTFGKPVFIRLDWEMNGTWYANYDQKGGTTPALYVASWQHVYTIFKAIAPNAAFVWCPNVGEFSDPNGVKTPNENWYPGDNYVDWVAVDAYPEYETNPPNIVTKSYGLNWSTDFATSHSKPLMLAEYGMREQAGKTAIPDSSTTFDIIFPWATAHPVVQAMLYFDFGSNHQLEAEPPVDPTTGATNPPNNPLGLAAYRHYTIGDSRYLYQVSP